MIFNTTHKTYWDFQIFSVCFKLLSWMDQKFWWINRLIDNFSDYVSLLNISSLDTGNIVAYGTADLFETKIAKAKGRNRSSCFRLTSNDSASVMRKLIITISAWLVFRFQLIKRIKMENTYDWFRTIWAKWDKYVLKFYTSVYTDLWPFSFLLLFHQFPRIINV